MSTAASGRLHVRAGRARKGSVPGTAALLPETVRLFTGFAAFGSAALTFGLSSNLLATALRSNGSGVPGTTGPLTTAATGPLTTAATGPVSLAGAVIVAAWGICLLLWAVQSLRRGSAVWPVLTIRILPAAVVAQLLAIIYGLWQLPAANRTFDLCAACAVVLELAMLGCLGWLYRTGAAHSTARGTAAPGMPVHGILIGGTTTAPPAGRLLAAMFAAALLVSAVATPGLAATTAGLHAVPHGEHGSTAPALHDPAGHHH